MKNSLILVIFGLVSFLSSSVMAATPNFKLVGNDGKTYELSKLKGKTVILEWYNEGCPFVKKFYNTGTMQKWQKELATKKDVVWLTISSSAKDRQGYISDIKKAKSVYKSNGMNSTALLLDSSGEAGQSFKAKTTPHMFIINKEGMIAYNGAIDSIASADILDIKKAKPLFLNAAKDVLAGRKVAAAKNRPYGCSVKY